MLFMLKQYPEAGKEVKELVLHKAVELSTNMGMLHDILVACGDDELAVIAAEKAAGLRNLFELWEGFDVMNLVSSAVSAMDGEAQSKYMADFVQLDPGAGHISASPLFSNVELGGIDSPESTVADQMADLMKALTQLR